MKKLNPDEVLQRLTQLSEDIWSVFSNRQISAADVLILKWYNFGIMEILHIDKWKLSGDSAP